MKIRTGLERNLSPDERHWAYCGIDSCVLPEIKGNLTPELTPQTEAIYLEELAWQGPALTMSLRGIRIDHGAVESALSDLWKNIGREERVLATEAQEVGFAGANEKLARSPKQARELFYGALGLPEHRNREGTVSADKFVLERLAKKYPDAVPFIERFRTIRFLTEQRKVLTRGISPDGRMRYSMNVGATETIRWSATKNAFNEGGNIQNIMPSMRNIFIADPGWVLFYADLEQADSRGVAYLAGDEAYIRAHKEGNVHVWAARIFWPDLPWTGDDVKDKELAKSTLLPWDPAHVYYDQAKRQQHGLNFAMSVPAGLALHARISFPAAREAGKLYFDAAPRIQIWHVEIAEEIHKTSVLTTPLGFRREFFGNPWEKDTIKEAISFHPQSTTSHVLCRGLYRVWDELDPKHVRVLANEHDAIMGEVRIGEEAVLERVVELMREEVPIRGRVMVIPTSVAVGENWKEMETWTT